MFLGQHITLKTRSLSVGIKHQQQISAQYKRQKRAENKTKSQDSLMRYNKQRKGLGIASNKNMEMPQVNLLENET